jgi:hypothetical protein
VIEVTPTIFFSVLGLYTSLLVGSLMWLNGRFSALEKAINERIPFYDYERKHDALEVRVRNLEVTVASKSWNDK